MESNETLQQRPALRVTPALIIGFAVLAIGVLMTLDNLFNIDASDYLRYWPVVLIIIGIVQLLNRGSMLFAALLIPVGVLLLLDNLYYIDFDLGDVFPLLLVVIGVRFVWTALRPKPAVAKGDEDSYFDSFVMMSGLQKKTASQQFRGGTLNVVMGGGEIDLRDAAPADGEAVIDLFVMWGGLDIRVPESWTVVSQVTPIMGGVEDKTRHPVTKGPRLVLTGTVLMGGIEIKNLPQTA